jgi:hypothetical protein
MSVPIGVSEELVSRMDNLTGDREAFVENAVRRMLRDYAAEPKRDDIAKINQLADELNREAEDVLEYQVLS